MINKAIIFLILFHQIKAYYWSPLSPHPGKPRHHPITFANATHGFLLTGTIQEGQSTASSKDFYVYEVATDTWKRLPDFPGVERSFSYGVTLGNYAYIGCGMTGTTLLSDFWRYNMINNQWFELKSFPGYGRRHPAMVATSNGRIYVGAGDGFNLYNQKWENFGDFWEYNIQSNSWLNIQPLPAIARHHPFFFHLGNTVYVGLGHSKVKLGERDWYQLENRQWTRLRDFASYGFSGNLVTTEGRVAGTQGSIDLCALGFVLSGDGDDHFTMAEGEFHLYYKNYDAWMSLPPHPGPSRWAPGSFVIGTKVYFTSGLDRSVNAMKSDLWSFDVIQYCF